MCAYRQYITQRDESYKKAEKWVKEEIEADNVKEAVESRKRAEIKRREKVLLEMAETQNRALAAATYQREKENERVKRRERWRADENLRCDRVERERGLSKTAMEQESWRKVEAATRRTSQRLVEADPHYCICGRLGFHSGKCPGAK
jgi:hypothetical protein